MKAHGFGTGPGMRRRPWSSFPAVIVTVYLVHSAKRGEGVRESTVRPPFQAPERVIPGSLNAHRTVLVFIGSLNVTPMTLSKGTLPAPSGGSVLVIFGLKQDVRNVHGFGTGPGTRPNPSSLSLPRVISTL